MTSQCLCYSQFIALFCSLLALPAVTAAQTSVPGPAASVLFADGVVTSNGGGQGYRVIGKGSRLAEGETISTGERSFAVIEFADKSRTTLRPDTVLNIEQFRYGNAAELDGMLLRLLRGGLRAATGLIGKARPEGGADQLGTDEPRDASRRDPGEGVGRRAGDRHGRVREGRGGGEEVCRPDPGWHEGGA